MFTKQVSFESRPSALNIMLLAFAAERRRRLQISIDICCRRLRSAANPSAVAAAVNRWDRQMDRQTDGQNKRYTDPTPHIMRATSMRVYWSIQRET